MNRLPPLTAAVLSLACAHLATHAAEAGKKPVKVEARKPAAAAKADRTVKPETRSVKKAPAGTRQPLASGREVQALAAAPEPVPVSPAQLEIAGRVLTGTAECELNQTVRVEPQPDRPGHFRVAFRNVAYSMVPEETSTGAVRLYDSRAEVVWLQIPTKSMLMNAKVGQRVVDACMQVEQRMAASAPPAGALGWSTPAPTLPAIASSLALPASQAAAPLQPVSAIAAAISTAPAPDLGTVAAAPEAAVAAATGAPVAAEAGRAAAGEGSASPTAPSGAAPAAASEAASDAAPAQTRGN